MIGAASDRRQKQISVPSWGAVATRRLCCSSVLQHDPPHRTAAGALEAGQQLRLPRTTAAAVVPHAFDDVADQHLALCHVASTRLFSAFSS
jgi:hypothetical protein